MNEIQKRFMNLLAERFDELDCDRCCFSGLCDDYESERTDSTVLCDVISNANIIVQSNLN